MIKQFLALLIALAGSMAAHATAAQNAEGEALRHAEALSIFDTACLGNLPGFAQASDEFTGAGLTKSPAGFWVDDQRGLIAQLSSSHEDRHRGCFVALSGADIGALDAVLGQVMGGAMGVEKVGVMNGPLPNDPALYVVEKGDYRVTAVAAHVSQG